MSYDKLHATREFTRWSESYDHSVLQWLLFGPSHRVLIRRVRAVAGDRPLKMLDVGCGTGLFAGRVRTALPNVEVWGVCCCFAQCARLSGQRVTWGCTAWFSTQ